ncbi:MAG: hypothetical protein QOJ14_654 [Thermoleophilaceae bacterium]|nr:hypothetical protein [Thermoleophilaceae bacterium]
MTARADPLEDRLLFVVGARRSGTNWVERMLTAHPDVVAMPSETNLFAMWVEPLQERMQHSSPGSPAPGKTFMPRAAFLAAVRAMLDRVFEDSLERFGTGARYLLERTPHHADQLTLIAEVYPGARAVHLVRDGRAVARSLLAMDWGPDTMEGAAAEWRTSVMAARAARELLGQRYLELRYERALADPGAAADELFGWLGLELTDAIREQVMREATSEYNVDPSTPGVRADKWRDQLTEEQVRVFERVAGDQLDSLGYERALPRGGSGRPRRTGGIRARLRRARHPRAAARAAFARIAARESERELQSGYRLFERFQELVAAGSDDRALELLAPDASFGLAGDDGALDGRGDDTARSLLAALGDHRRRGWTPLTGAIHASPRAFSSVGTYELSDGSRWAQTIAVNTSGGQIMRVAVYRFRLAPADARDRAAPPPARP